MLFEAYAQDDKPKAKYNKGDEVNYIPKLSGLPKNKVLVIDGCRWEEEDTLAKSMGVKSKPTWVYSFEDSDLSAIEDDIKPAKK